MSNEAGANTSYHQERETANSAPGGCPVNHSWSPLNDDYLAEPYSIAGELRDDTPVFFSETLGYLVVNTMDEIERIFMDHETFASVNVQDPVFPLSDDARHVLAVPDYNPVAVMSNRPEPDHGVIRRHTRGGFSNRRMKILEPYMRQRSHTLIDAMEANGSPLEFVKAFAFPLPGETVFRFIGFPESDDEMLKTWCLERKAFSWGNPTDEEQVRIAEQMVSYWRYCREFTANKRDNRSDDFASELLTALDENPDEMTYNEVESIIYGLSFAGHEAVTSLIGNSLVTLFEHRPAWEAICADPSLIPNAIDEVLRYNSSQISWRRLTTAATSIGGFDVPAGTPIFLNFAAANRESGVFDNPDSFDIYRANANRHISFGKGVHFCLGARLARFETQVVLEVLTDRLPSLRRANDAPLSYFPNITFRGPQTLDVAWD